VYAGLLTGKFNELDAASLARIVADGGGNLTLEQVRSVGGATQCTGARSCTYSIEPSGFGPVSCGPFTPPPCVGSTNTVIVHILLSDGGQQFDLFLEGTNIAGHLIRQ
jgi:hypothetical protein